VASLLRDLFQNKFRERRAGTRWREFFDRDDGFSFCVVLEDARGALVGFAKGERHDGGVPGYAGELNKIYLLRRVQRRGLGRMLLSAVAARFMERGVTSMLLFGDAASPSNGFYEASGGERLYSEQGEFHGGYGWPDLRRLAGSAPANQANICSSIAGRRGRPGTRSAATSRRPTRRSTASARR